MVIDSTGLKAHMLRRRIADEFLPRGPASRLAVSLESFGFKRGPARDADMVLDVRFLPNPHYEPDLRPLTGHDQRVVDYVGRDGQLEAFYERLEPLLDYLLPQYVAEGKAHLTIAVGCTGGTTAPWPSPSIWPAAGASATTCSSRSPTATSRTPIAATATVALPDPSRVPSASIPANDGRVVRSLDLPEARHYR